MRQKFNLLIYSILGLLGTGVDYIGYYYLNKFGIFYVISLVLASVSGSTVSFFVHKKWTFENKKGHEKQLNLYLFISFLFFLMNLSATSSIVEFLHLEENVARAIIGSILFYPNYRWVRKKVFKF